MLDPFKTEADRLTGQSVRIDKNSHQTWAGEDGIFNVATGEILVPPVNFKKIIFFYTIISIIFLIFLSQVFYLEVIKGDYFTSLGAGRGTRVEVVKAKRGLFFDRHLQQLVKNVSNFSLTVVPARFRQADNQSILEAVEQYLLPDQKQELQNNFSARLAFGGHNLNPAILRVMLEMFPFLQSCHPQGAY